MKLLKNIGFAMTMLGFCGALVTLYITRDIVKLDVLYFLFMFSGCCIQVFAQCKILKETKEINVQNLKYMFGCVSGIFCFLGILIWLVKEFYFS